VEYHLIKISDLLIVIVGSLTAECFQCRSFSCIFSKF